MTIDDRHVLNVHGVWSRIPVGPDGCSWCGRLANETHHWRCPHEECPRCHMFQIDVCKCENVNPMHLAPWMLRAIEAYTILDKNSE
jgi:hypothetical protein